MTNDNQNIVSYSLVVLIYGDYEYGSKRIKEAEQK